MATSYRFDVGRDSGILRFERDEKTAAKVSELLQKDLETHNVYFNAQGFHNHIPHSLLSLYGTGAGPSRIQSAFDANSTYQLPLRAVRPEVLADLQSDYIAALPKYIGKGGHYPSFLRFFQLEIDQRGGDWRSVLRQYLFPGCQDDQAGEDAALELLSRLYSGFMHPMLHLMFGIEWDQPALVAEALAQTAVHPDDAKLRRFFVESEKKASAGNNDQEYGTHFADIFQQAAKSDTLRESSPYHEASDPRVALYHGVLTRAYDEVVDLAAAMTVPQRHLKEKMAEASHVSALVATMAAWRPPHIPKFDFYFIHHINVMPFFHKLNIQEWVPEQIKTRLLEWKMRLDLLQYISRGSPPLTVSPENDPLDIYVPREGPDGLASDISPRDLLPRVMEIEDDGHTIKLARALIIAQDNTRHFADRGWVRIHNDKQWLRIHHMLLHGVEGQPGQWVRSAGFKEAWGEIPVVE